MKAFQNAYRIAAAHGHMWATRIDEETALSLYEGGGMSLVSQAAVALGDNLGRDRPAEGEDEGRAWIGDSTSTGRANWRCYEDGEVQVQVTRPTGPVLFLVVKNGQIEPPAIANPSVGWRHVQAAMAVISAVTPHVPWTALVAAVQAEVRETVLNNCLRDQAEAAREAVQFSVELGESRVRQEWTRRVVADDADEEA